jgi:hypothetical protein
MKWDTQRSLQLPQEVRDVLDELSHEAPPDEREFSARLHRNLAAAGAPPAPGWLERLQGWASDLWQDASQKRTLATGAVIGALATATAFLLLSGGHPFHDGGPTVSPDDDTAEVDAPGLDRSEHKALRAVGDRRITRDRLGDDLGADRPERARLPNPRSR